MKRCPECRRDYLDETLLYCLDDGSRLLEGPASTGERATAVLHETAQPSEAATRAQIHTTAAEEPQGRLNDSTEKQSLPAHRAAKPLAVLIATVLILAVGFFAHRSFAPTKQIESIVVMPFVNESGNSDVEYLSDGMTETLIKSLSQVPNLSVKSRSTVFYYKGKETSPKKIGEELKVQAVLLGRVGGRGDDLKLSLELVNTQTEDVIWAEAYDRKQSDLLSLQSEIAKDVSTKLKSKLSGADEANVAKTSTRDAEAYQAYLKGRYYWNRRTAENLKKAIEQFKAATDRDPNYALAYAGLADCYSLLPEYAGKPIRDAIPQAKAYAERAIAIDDQLAEAYTSLGQANRRLWLWAEGEKHYKRAIELNPNYATAYHWYSLLLRALGRFDESAVMIQKAHEIDPLSNVIAINISEIYQIQNDHDASIENCRKIIELDPNYAAAYEIMGLSYLRQGRNAEALANLEKAVEMTKRVGTAITSLGYAYGVTGKRAEATAIVKELEEKYTNKESNAMSVATVYSGLGEKEKAYEWLEKAFQNREDVTLIRWRLPYDSLRDYPRYKDLLQRMGLPV